MRLQIFNLLSQINPELVSGSHLLNGVFSVTFYLYLQGLKKNLPGQQNAGLSLLASVEKDGELKHAVQSLTHFTNVVFNKQW
ncbi:hypothetical protein [uncultured Winogradskyella sp.]|uniref:hypothetical protein n=1 Tax=uncultured Winogradskyella sp. TaxID=395353 RepID=UPI002634CF52|nr:hypothetical protein [uncultured Winogradskyella sp.]